MPTGQDLVNWCVAQRGHPYSWTNRFGPDNFDCSGLITAACWAHGLEPTGFNSTGLEIWCRDNGLGIDLGTALNTPGALVFVWGYGADGHVAMSMGDGRLIETPSQEGHMVGISNFWRMNWTGAALIPGVDYGGGAVGGGKPMLSTSTPGPNEYVRGWQQFLGIETDGYFGPITEQKVKDFQALFGLEADGIIGPDTWGARDFVESGAAGGPTAPQEGDPILQQGSQGDAVAGWQNFLNAVQLNAPIGGPLAVDGDFGPHTTEVVKNFQRICNLEADGVIGPQTWGARRYIESLPKPEPTPPPAAPKQVLDYSWARPTADAVAKVAEGVIRYISYDTSGKNLSAGEYQALKDAGLKVALVWENGAADALSDKVKGRQDATDAERMADALGYPANGVIYYAVDTNAKNDSRVTDYFVGVNEVAKRPVGFYGGDNPAFALKLYGLVQKVWQAAAASWSDIFPHPDAELVQQVGNSTGLSNVDVNFVQHDGWDVGTPKTPEPGPTGATGPAATGPTGPDEPGPTGASGPTGPPTEYRFSENDILVIMEILLEHKPYLSKRKQKAIKEDLLAAVI